MPVFSKTFRSLLAVAALLLAATTALADPFPSKPVRILVPYAAGGTTAQSSFRDNSCGQKCVAAIIWHLGSLRRMMRSHCSHGCIVMR